MIPVLGKDELCDLQASQPPSGGYLAVGARPRRVFQSPGPIYGPQFGAPDPSRWAPALRAAVAVVLVDAVENGGPPTDRRTWH